VAQSASDVSKPFTYLHRKSSAHPSGSVQLKSEVEVAQSPEEVVAVATWEQARRHPPRQFPQGAPQGRRVDATSIQISLIRGLPRNYVPSYLEALNLQLLHQLPVVDHHGLNSSVNRFGMICGSDKISTKNYADILFPTGDLMVGTILAGATVM